MYQRPMCPSMGLAKRPLSRELVALSNCAQRSFHVSISHREDAAAGSSSGSAPSSTPNPNRRERTQIAFRRLQNLGRTTSSTEQTTTTVESQTNTPSRPFVRRRPPPPPGTLVKAPTNLRLTRGPRAPGSRAPRPDGANLFGRGGSFADRKPGNREGDESRPKPRGKKREDNPQEEKEEDGADKFTESITNGMIQQLLLLQRKEWDRQTYEPIYAKKENLGELVSIGNSLFKGENPKPKEKTKLDKKFDEMLGIQNMFIGAQYQAR